eukprot:scaffold189347_cov19-Tisochrysis_lutea.AAC.1
MPSRCPCRLTVVDHQGTQQDYVINCMLRRSGVHLSHNPARELRPTDRPGQPDPVALCVHSVEANWEREKYAAARNTAKSSCKRQTSSIIKEHLQRGRRGDEGESGGCWHPGRVLTPWMST